MSSPVVDITGLDRTIDELIDEAAALRGAEKTSYSGGGGGDMLEQRVGRLEGQMDRALTDLSDIKATIARIDARLDSKVDYKWLTIYVLGIVAVIMRNEIAALLTG